MLICFISFVGVSSACAYNSANDKKESKSSFFPIGVWLQNPKSTTAKSKVFQIPAEYLREPETIPSYWITEVTDVEKFLKTTVKKGELKVIGTSAGGRPISAVFYGNPRKGKGTTTFSGSLGFGNVAAYRGPDHDKTVFMGMAGVHGGEFEGIVGMVNLISVLETGKDLRGKEWPEINTLASRMDRIILIPMVNPDGRSRIPIRMQAYRGTDNTVAEYFSTGGKSDGSLTGWPQVKKFIPYDFSQPGFPGGYPNDAGVNIQHDDFFGKPQPETRALLDLCQIEKPDLIFNMHSGGTEMLLHQSLGEPVLNQVFDSLFHKVQTVLAMNGLQNNKDPKAAASRPLASKFSFNLDGALNLNCGALCVIVESASHGWSGKNEKGDLYFYSPDKLIDAQLICHREAMKFLLESGGRSKWTPGPLYTDASRSLEERVTNILGLLTLEEKADFLTGVDFWHLKGVSRLGIPSVQVTDCGHGVTIVLDKDGNWIGNSSCFPTAVGQAATWNKTLIKEVGAALGRETRATGSAILLAPMVNIKRIPLNGRNYELFSEDPKLSGELAASFIQGVQSENIGAVIKAMAANNQQANQQDIEAIVDERTLQEIYLTSFRIAVQKANPWGVMTSYNGLNGSRTSDYKYMLQTILKDTWGYEGFVVSDWRAVKSIKSLYSGLDLEMPGPGKIMTKENVLKAIGDKSLSMDELNDKVKRLLRALVKTKLLDQNNPSLNSELNSKKHQDLTRRVSEEGIVLLKNEGSVLPLKKSIRKLAVIGPNAGEARLGGGGSASVSPFYSVSPLAGLKALCGSKTQIIFQEGCGLNGSLQVLDSLYLSSVVNSKKIKGLKAEYFNNKTTEGLPVLSSSDSKIDFSWGWANPRPEVDKRSFSVRWSGQLTPPASGEYKIGLAGAQCGYRLYLDGKLIINEWNEAANENFEATFTAINKSVNVSLTKDITVDVRIEFHKIGNRNFIRFEWEIPGNNSIEMAKKAAKESDAVVIFAGLSNFFEGGNNDRPNIDLPGEQNKLISEIAKVNPNTIVVLINGSALAMPWINDVKSVLEAYYPGQEGGNAIANVLFGNVNPSGKLPETFPVKLSDTPAYNFYPGANDKITYSEGIYVGYRHYDTKNIAPLFPFGFGLSYTKFAYSNLKIDTTQKTLKASFDLKNTGDYDGAEVVQLYLHKVKTSEDRPSKELKNFEKIFLKKGESQHVSLDIEEADLMFFSQKRNKWVTEPGEFEVLIGSSSRDIRLKGIFSKK